MSEVAGQTDRPSTPSDDDAHFDAEARQMDVAATRLSASSDDDAHATGGEARADRPGPASGEDAQVTWDEARAANRANWDDRAPQHVVGYGALDLARDPERVPVADDVAVLAQHLPGGTLEGLDVIHLQCHIGTDTIGLARCGARVTGLDLSPASLREARKLARVAGLHITYVESDVMDARAAVTGNFDVVFTSVGALCWLQDLDRWAAQVAALLRPGGVFYVRDGHPALHALDEDTPTLRFRYFPNGKAMAWDDDASYVPGVTLTHTRSYEFPHSMSEIVTALLRAGLSLERFDEGQVLDWQATQYMVPQGQDWVMPEHLRDTVPLTFTLVARRPRG